MKTRTAVLAAVVLAACASVTCGQDGRAVGTKVAPFTEGDRVVFLGDSITHGGWYIAYLQYFWQLRNPGKRITFLNGGICGHTAKSGLDRFDWDIAPEKPNRVFIMFGMNDVSRGNRWNPAKSGPEDLAARRKTVDDFRRNMRALIAKCRGIGADVTLITPTPYDEYSKLIAKPASRGVNEQGLRSLAAATRELAAEEGVGFVEFHDILTPILRDNPSIRFLSDRVHPHDDGHLLMAVLVMEATGFPAEVDGAGFDAAGGARTFTYSPRALPLPANADYRSDDRLFPLTEKFNREIIRIKGLPAGIYRLKAAGREIGVHSAAELAGGVNIATCDTPSQRKADKGLGEKAAPLKKLAGRLRGLPQGYFEILKRGGDINDQASSFAKLDEWIEELRVANAENGHYYRYYGREVKSFKELYPIRDAEKARLEALRQDIFDWCRPEPFEIAVEPLARATFAAEGDGSFKVTEETADGRYFCEYAPTVNASAKPPVPGVIRACGLPNGAYNLRLGDVFFGEFSAQEFADGVDIGRTATHCLYAVIPPLPPYVVRIEKVRIAADVPELAGKDRAKLKDVFENQVFGKRPVERPPVERFVQLSPDESVCDGRGLKRRMKAVLGNGKGGEIEVRFTAYIPSKPGRHPSFILVAPHDPDRIAEPVSATRPARMPVSELLERGYAGISYKNNDCALDKEGRLMTNGVWEVFGPTGAERTPTSWGAISAWAWGASRVMDWVETCPELDAARVAVVGLSRCGKTALWAGASDERFALTVSCCSGCGGAKLNRADLPASEHFVHLKTAQPHWFCKNFYRKAGREECASFDMHELVAMCAPRLVLIASASEDNWAGPSGEFMSGLLASPAWEKSGKRGLVAPEGYPPPATPLQEGLIAYHRRIGKHGQTSYDWQRYMDFADAHGFLRSNQGRMK